MKSEAGSTNSDTTIPESSSLLYFLHRPSRMTPTTMLTTTENVINPAIAAVGEILTTCPASVSYSSTTSTSTISLPHTTSPGSVSDYECTRPTLKRLISSLDTENSIKTTTISSSSTVYMTNRPPGSPVPPPLPTSPIPISWTQKSNHIANNNELPPTTTTASNETCTSQVRQNEKTVMIQMVGCS